MDKLTAEVDSTDVFETQRKRLARVAYRMLGSVSEAEDAVQDTFLRWHGTQHVEVRDPAGFLTRIVTNVCLDRLRSAQRTREIYVGPWLPEPIVDAAPAADDVDDVSMVLMLALERLSPLERAAFLLHDVFGVGFDEIALTIERAPAACRQLASRARRHIRSARPRFPVSPSEGERIAEAFLLASRLDDATGLSRLLAEDAVTYTDGGGMRPAAINPIVGRERVVAMFRGLARKVDFRQAHVLRRGWVNGLPGFVTMERGDVLQTTGLLIEDGIIQAIYIVRNPDKLAHLTMSGMARETIQ